MKFLCIACNTQMKLIKNDNNIVPDEKGSLSIKWECPECLYEMGMLTNPFETQLVSSIGVEIGGNTVKSPPNISSATDPTDNPATSSSSSGGKCPFSETARDAMMESARAGGMGEGIMGDGGSQLKSHGMNEAQQMKNAMGFAAATESSTMQELNWTAQAMVRLQNIPEFIRPVAKKGIEKFARDKGLNSVDESVLDKAKEHFDM